MKSTTRLYACFSIAFCVAWRLAAFPIAAFVSAPARFFDLVVTALPFIWTAPIGVMKAVAFKVIGWLPMYLKWLFYALGTTYMRRSATTVTLKGKD